MGACVLKGHALEFVFFCLRAKKMQSPEVESAGLFGRFLTVVLDLRLSVWESVRVVICLGTFQTVTLALRK